MLGNSRISSWEQEVSAELQVDLQVDKAFGFQLLLKHPAAFAQQDLGLRNWPLQPENSRAALPLIDAPTRKRAICRMDAAYKRDDTRSVHVRFAADARPERSQTRGGVTWQLSALAMVT